MARSASDYYSAVEPNSLTLSSMGNFTDKFPMAGRGSNYPYQNYNFEGARSENVNLFYQKFLTQNSDWELFVK